MRARLDVWLVERGLAESREKAQALVMAGRVRVDGRAAAKPGTAVPKDAEVEVLPGPSHVGRGALKLAGALDHFGVDPSGRVAVDVGASTGGFTEVLLARGARRVYAVDVGRGQLHERLRGDPRVAVRDRVNARGLSAADVPEPCGLATVDVSFISVLKVLPALRVGARGRGRPRRPGQAAVRGGPRPGRARRGWSRTPRCTRTSSRAWRRGRARRVTLSSGRARRRRGRYGQPRVLPAPARRAGRASPGDELEDAMRRVASS